MTTSPLNILVFDDNKTNRNAAKAQLKNHNLTVVGTYDEAQRLLTPNYNKEAVRELAEGLWPNLLSSPENSSYGEREEAFRKAKTLARQVLVKKPKFDVVLTDLLVPVPHTLPLADKSSVGAIVPIGIYIALLAATRGGAKYVGVFTDSDHHTNYASACFDGLNVSGESHPGIFQMNNARILFSNNRQWIDYFLPDDLSDKNHGDGTKARKKDSMVRCKDWRNLLDYLLSTPLTPNI